MSEDSQDLPHFATYDEADPGVIQVALPGIKPFRLPVERAIDLIYDLLDAIDAERHQLIKSRNAYKALAHRRSRK